MVVTILIGIAGAVVGGYAGTYFGFGKVTGFDFRSFAIAVGGSFVLLLAYRLFRG